MFFVCLYTKLHLVLRMNGGMFGPVFSQDTSRFLAGIWKIYFSLVTNVYQHAAPFVFLLSNTKQSFGKY